MVPASTIPAGSTAICRPLRRSPRAAPQASPPAPPSIERVAPTHGSCGPRSRARSRITAVIQSVTLSIDRLLPVTAQNIAACWTKLWTIFLQASQDSKIALIHQLTAETLHVARASLLLLISAAVSEGAN